MTDTEDEEYFYDQVVEYLFEGSSSSENDDNSEEEDTTCDINELEEEIE